MRYVSYMGKRAWEGCRKEGKEANIFQMNCIESFLKENEGISIKKKYVEFDKMVSDGVAEKYDCIIIASVYFCGDGCAEAEIMLGDTLYQAGLRFIIAEEHIDSGKMNAEDIKHYFETKRRMLRSLKVKKWINSKGPGYVIYGSVPYGYVRNKETGRIIQDETVSPYVKEIFARAEAGKSLKSIALYLNEACADTPLVHKKKRCGRDVYGLNNKWNENMVRRIINNPIHTKENGKKKNNGSNLDKKKKNRNTPLSSYVYCKKYGRMLVCRELKSTDGYTFCCTKRCSEGMEENICRIPYQKVYDMLMDRLKEERNLAGMLYKSIGTNKFMSEYKKRKDSIKRYADTVIENMKPGMYERTDMYKAYTEGLISACEYESRLEEYTLKYSRLNDELELLFKEGKRLDTIFGADNPWIKLFNTEEPYEITDRKSAGSVLERIEIDMLCREKEIKADVYFKYGEWKKELMADIAGEDTKDVTKEQKK